MAKAVLISIQPKWCELIASGEKTVEVRKTRPKLETPFKCYIYMTTGDASIHDGKGMVHHHSGGRCVIGEFVCDRVCPIAYTLDGFADVVDSKTTCMRPKEFIKYGTGKPLYGWHISDLVIYDKPKELNEFYKCGTLSADDFLCQLYDGSGNPRRSSYASYLFTQQIRGAPQSWCYVEELKGGAK